MDEKVLEGLERKLVAYQKKIDELSRNIALMKSQIKETGDIYYKKWEELYNFRRKMNKGFSDTTNAISRYHAEAEKEKEVKVKVRKKRVVIKKAKKKKKKK